MGPLSVLKVVQLTVQRNQASWSGKGKPRGIHGYQPCDTADMLKTALAKTVMGRDYHLRCLYQQSLSHLPVR